MNQLVSHIKKNIGEREVIFSEERNFLYLKVGKTAGTSMYRGIMKNEISDVCGHKDNPQEFLSWWNDLTDENIDNYFKFTFIRNPFDRLVSAFNHVVLHGRGKDITFEDFVKNGLSENNTHWRPQSNYVETDGYQIVDFVGKYENLKEDWSYVANKIGVTNILPQIRWNPWPHNLVRHLEVLTKGGYHQLMDSQTVVSDYRKYYNDELVDIVSKYYKKDLELFNYEY